MITHNHAELYNRVGSLEEKFKALQERLINLDCKPILEMEHNEIGWVEKGSYHGEITSSTKVYAFQNTKGTRRQIRKSKYDRAYIFSDEEKYGDEALIFID